MCRSNTAASVPGSVRTGSAWRLAGRTLLALAIGCAPAAAQYEVVVDLGAPAGRAPRGGLIEGVDGCLYGTTVDGGAGHGTVYQVCSGVMKTIVTFDGTSNGRYPQAALALASDSRLYGTTRLGGASNAGTIFALNPSTGTLTTLHVFSGADGSESVAELIEGTDGRLYGVTSLGGTANKGTVFSIQKSGAGFTVLKSFTGTNGRSPTGKLVQVSGSFYGTTSMGGANEMGTVFQMTSGGSLTTLLSFNGTNGAYPYAGLENATDGYLYGLTAGGGTSNNGTAFRLHLSGTLTVLRSFSGSDGSFPYAELTQATDGLFYGTTMYGGSGSGVVFKMTSAGAVTLLRSLSTSDGTLPEGALVQASNGKIYGTTPNSGPSGAAGTVFEITSSGAFTRILAFNGAPATPYGQLLARADGSLYGVSAGGGAMSAGTIFKLVPGVSFEVLYGFSGTQDGSGAYDGLTLGSDGALYGTAPKGGANTVGTIYKLATGDTFKLLAAASTSGSNGFYPYGSVAQGSDGAFYGVMSAGGAGSAGTIYRMTSAGAVTLAHAFDSAKHGSRPYGRLVAASNGLLYGTTIDGGSSYGGTLFSYDPAAKRFTVVYTFTGTHGSNPFAGLIEGTDGRLYGTAFAGGAHGYGTIFAFDKGTGQLTLLHSFKGSDGGYPYASLFEAADGRLYGTTSAGGANNLGTIFSIQKSGSGFAVMHSFNGTNGSVPRGGLTQGADFALYGVTPKGGSTNSGVIFRIEPLGSGGGLGAPSNLTATAASTTRVNLAWTIHSTGETGFQVERCTGSSCSDFALIGTAGPQTASYADTTVSQQTTYRYRVRAAGASSTSAYSNIASVTTTSTATITVTAPNTGVNWAIGSTQRIKWKHNGSKGSTVRIQISRDSGGTWTDIASSVANSSDTAGSYKWVVTGGATGRARIRVAFTDGSAADTSDKDFTLAAPFIEVTSPDVSATAWTTGTNAVIKWSSNLGSLEKVKIELSKDGGATYAVTVLSSTPSDGSQSVPVQTSWLTSNAKVRISWLKDTGVRDASDQAFTIR